MTEKTWTIIENGVTRTVTLAQFRAEMDARTAAAKPISDAWRRGDIAGTEAAQVAFRKQFAR